MLIVFDELFLGGRKLNISLAFISQSYFKVPKTIRLNVTHYLTTKMPKKRELQQIALNHSEKRSTDIEFKDFINLYKDYTKEPFSFLVNDTTLPPINPLIFRKNPL